MRYYNIELGYFSDMFIEDIDSKVIDEVEDSWYIEEREGYTWAETETDPPSTDYHFEGFNKGERFFDLKWDFLLDEYRDMFSTMDELRAEIENSLRFMDDVSIYTNISSESGEFTAHVYSYPKTSITEIDGGFRVEMKFKFSDDGVEGI